MSLINQMLQDLDARQAAPGDGRPLPSAVRPLPQRRPARWPWALGAVALLALAAGLLFYRDELGGRGAPASAPAAVASSPPASPASPTTPPTPVLAVSAVVPPPVAPPARADEGLRLRATPELVVPLEKRNDSRPAKSPAIAGEQASRPVGRTPPASPPALPPTAATPAPLAPVAGKPVKGMSIERSDGVTSADDRADADYRKAIAALNQGRSGEAVDILRSALRSDALHRSARQLLVKLLLETKRPEEAIEVLQDGLQGQPAQIGWAMALARLQVDRGELSAAWKTLDASLPAAGQSADYQGFAAHVLQRLGRQREAIARFQAAARLAPADGRWWLGLGLAHEAEGNTNEAREAFAHARQSANLSPELLALIEQKLR